MLLHDRKVYTEALRKVYTEALSPVLYITEFADGAEPFTPPDEII